MRMIYFFALWILFSNNSFAQINTTSIAEKKLDKVQPYDSLSNFLGKDTHNYIGQDLYLKEVPESSRKYGYDGFYLDYKESTIVNKSNVYKCCDNYNSKYDELKGKYFHVLAVHKHPKAKESEYLYGKKSYLELVEKESGDKLYYEYDGDYEHSFPFIIVGFFEKIKEVKINKEIIIRGVNWLGVLEPMYDVVTGEKVDLAPGSKWKYIDLIIDDKYYDLNFIIENQKGNKIRLPQRFSENENFLFSLEDANKYRNKFGAERWDKILNGKVVVGFTEEMAILSWGKPNSINRSSHGGDQWVYDDQYLYFEKGVLKSWN